MVAAARAAAHRPGMGDCPLGSRGEPARLGAEERQRLALVPALSRRPHGFLILLGTVFRCAIEPRGAEAAPEGYDVVIEGDGFLYKMVRIIAGTLLMVGMGLAPPETVVVALFSEAAGDTEAPEGASAGDLGAPKSELRRRGVVGPTLPPERLCLEHVEYERDHDSRFWGELTGP